MEVEVFFWRIGGVVVGRAGGDHQEGEGLRARGRERCFFAILDVEGLDVVDAVEHLWLVVAGGGHDLVGRSRVNNMRCSLVGLWWGLTMRGDRRRRCFWHNSRKERDISAKKEYLQRISSNIIKGSNYIHR